MNLDPRTLAQALRAAAEVLDRAAHARTAERTDWIDQSSSPLGPRRHCKVVRQRLAEGLPGAATAGRRHLLSTTALAEELQGARRGRADVNDLSSGEAFRRKLRAVGSDA